MESVFISDLTSFGAFVLFLAAVFGLWVPYSRKISLGLFFGFLVVGSFSGGIYGIGWVWSAVFVLCCSRYSKSSVSKGIKGVYFTIVLVLAALLMAHKLPGFNNWKLFSKVLLSPDAIPYSLYFNFDKAIVGYSLLLWGCVLCQSREDWTGVFRVFSLMLPVTVLVVVCFSFLLGYVRFDPKIVEMTPIWILNNLFITCVAEEAFFRGLIQKNLIRAFSKMRWGSALGLLVASILFGVAHVAGGWKYVFLATIAGIFYGMAYLKSNRIEASILIHFSLNLIHFLFFTYPALRSSM